MEQSKLSSEESWHGSYYELSIAFSPQGDDERLLQAIHALWRYPALTGPWSHIDNLVRRGARPGKVPIELEPEGLNNLYGLLKLPGEKVVGCCSLTVRETLREDGADWLDVCIPTGMLNLVFTVRYPLLIQDNPWIHGVDEILARIGDWVYRASPFHFAIVGEEVSGFVSENELTSEHVERGGYLISPQTLDRLVPDTTPAALPNGLLWFPREG